MRILRKAFKFSFYTAVILLIVGLVAEYFFRKSGEYPLSGIQYDEHLIWRLKSNHSESRMKGEKLLEISFNDQGFRDNDFIEEKSPGVKRILVLGDSYTFGGIEHSQSEIFTSQFEQLLNDTDSGKYEVMNVSVPAWATDQQLNYLKYEGIKYKPDVLILVSAPNDIRESFCKTLYELDSDDKLIENEVLIPIRPRIGWYFSNYSCLFQYLQKKVISKNYGTYDHIYQYYKSNFGKEDADDWDRPLFMTEPIAEVQQARQLYKRLLSEIKTICDKNDIEFGMTLLPIKAEFEKYNIDSTCRPGIVNEFCARVAGELNIPYFDLFEKANNLDDPLSIYIKEEYHYNLKGHTWMGEQLVDFFNQLSP